MEAPTHYIEATILPLDGTAPSRADIAFATSAIMSCVHLVIVEGAEVSVSFPKISVNDGATTTGSVIRVFGSVLDLAKLLARPDFASLNAGGMFRLGKEAIRPIPETVGWETYRRVRSVERTFEGFERREARHLDRNPGRSRTSRPKQPREKMAFINMRSSSTGDHRFSMFIGKITADGFVSGKPNSYGLGVTVPSF